MSELRKISRREFMNRTGQAGGGLVFALTFATACQPGEMAVGPAAKATASVAPNVYVNIRNDGIVEIYCHRSEMGQGIRTSLPQVIADELEADWDDIFLPDCRLHSEHDPKTAYLDQLQGLIDWDAIKGSHAGGTAAAIVQGEFDFGVDTERATRRQQSLNGDFRAEDEEGVDDCHAEQEHCAPLPKHYEL